MRPVWTVPSIDVRPAMSGSPGACLHPDDSMLVSWMMLWVWYALETLWNGSLDPSPCEWHVAERVDDGPPRLSGGLLVERPVVGLARVCWMV